MANGIEVARAVVTIMPSLEGAQKTIVNELTPAAESAADKAGKESGAKFTSKFSSALKSGTKAIGAAVAASVASVTALSASFYSAAKATAQYGDNVDKLSQKMGLSAEAYQEWDFIAQHSGTSMESLKAAMTKLTTAAGNGNDAFQALGISAEQAQKMSREELWNATISALTGVKDETERARLAQSLFGRGAMEMGALLNTSSEDLAAMKQQCHDLGIVMSNEDVKASAAFQDSLQNMQQSFGGLKNSLISKFLPGITTVMDGLSSIFSGNSGSGVAKITEGIQSITGKITEMLPGIISAGTQILTSLISSISNNLPLLVPAAAEIIITLAKGIITALPTILQTGGSVLLELVKGIIENGPSLMKQAAVVLSDFAKGLVAKLPELLPVAGQIIIELGKGIVANTPELIKSAIKAVGDFLAGIIGKLPEVLKTGGDIVKTMLAGIGEHLPGVVDAFSGAMSKIVKAISDAFPNVADGIAKIATACKPIVDVVAAGFVEVAKVVGQTISDMVKALAPYTPAITHMVETVTANLPSIIDSFTALFSQVKPIIDGIVSLVKTIGQAVVDIVGAVGTNLGLIVDAFSGFNQSLAVPIKAVGDAISGMINAISDGIVAVNNSISGVLDKLAGVFDSIGQAALNAGQGFKTIADACVDLANNTSVIDLAATLGAVATGIKNINHEAKWAYDNKIGEAVAQVGAGLKTLVDYSTGVDGVSTAMDTLAESVKKINNEIKGGVASQNIANFGTAINTMVTNAGTEFDTLGISVETCLDKIKALCSEGSASLSQLASTIKTSLAGDKTEFNTNFNSIQSTASSSMSAVSRDVTSGMNSSSRSVSSGLGRMQGMFNKTSFSFGNRIRLPHFGMSGKFNAETGEVPFVWVRWYDKGGIFDHPSIIGVGEKRPEFVGALDDLREIVREESNTANVTINVYGSEGQSVRELANIVMERIQSNITRKEAAFA